MCKTPLLLYYCPTNVPPPAHKRLPLGPTASPCLMASPQYLSLQMEAISYILSLLSPEARGMDIPSSLAHPPPKEAPGLKSSHTFLVTCSNPQRQRRMEVSRYVSPYHLLPQRKEALERPPLLSHGHHKERSSPEPAWMPKAMGVGAVW